MYNPTKNDILKAVDVIITQVGNGYYVSREDLIRAQHAARIINKAIEEAERIVAENGE